MGLPEAFQIAVLGQQHARPAMDVTRRGWGLGVGVELIEQALQRQGGIEAGERLAWRFLERHGTHHLQAQP